MKTPYIDGSTARVEGGRKAKSSGDSFERWIETQHDKALRLGILAHVWHNQAKAEVRGGKLIFVGKGIADYTGTCERGGRTLAEEAKSVQKDYLPYSMIDKLQAEHLDAVAHAGGLALLLAEFRHEALPRRYAIPWLEVPWAILRSAKSISSADVAQWEISRDPGGCYLARFHAPGPRSLPLKKTWEPPR